MAARTTKRKAPAKKAEPKKPQGRPTLYTKELHAEVCERLSRGETLADICRDLHMPAVRTISDWKADHEDFSADFARARETGGHAIAARLRRTARGYGPDLGGDSTSDVQRDRLIVETDLKLLAKWFPRDYGDKTQIDLGNVDAKPLTVRLVSD